MHGNIPYMFVYLADTIVHLLLLKSSTEQTIRMLKNACGVFIGLTPVQVY